MLLLLLLCLSTQGNLFSAANAFLLICVSVSACICHVGALPVALLQRMRMSCGMCIRSTAPLHGDVHLLLSAGLVCALL